MLPEKWAVERNRDNYRCINRYFNNLNKRNYTSNGFWRDKEGNEYGFNYMISPKLNGKTSVTELPEGYIIISFEQFRIDVLHRKPIIKNYDYELY